MSDIGLRFDGLFLFLALALGTILWSIVAVIAVGVGLIRARARAWQVARLAGVLAVVAFCVTAVFAVWWDKNGASFSGAEWLDQLTYPWGIVFLAGCWWLARVR